jgi:hypothetical protein
VPGPFYFAWVDAGDVHFGPEHLREDELVHTFQITHEEGQIPTLSIGIKNPKVGLLAPGRRVWVWLSWFDQKTGHVHPLFFGRLVGIPDSIINEVVTLQIIAKPLDYQNQKQAVAETMKVAPWYDPIFIDEAHRDDPDTILEGYSSLWHLDRTTLEVTASDILIGEDGNEIFDEDQAFYDGVQLNIGSPPLVTAVMDATVSWTQAPPAGVINMGFHTQETVDSGIWGGWPKPGTSLGGGWQVAQSSVTDLSGVEGSQSITYTTNWSNKEKEHEDGDTMSTSHSVTKPTMREYFQYVTKEEHTPGFVDSDADPPINIGSSQNTQYAVIPVYKLNTLLFIQYEANRPRTERIVFTLNADLQPIITLPESPDTSEWETIQLNGSDVGVPIGSEIPIGDIGRRSYFPTDRGQQSLEYLIAVARAHILMRSRAVSVTFQTRFERGIGMSCRKNATLFDNRLPGGVAIGKVTKYTLNADGDSGVLYTEITIGCAVGTGNPIASIDQGDTAYVELGYVDDGYQALEGGFTLLASGDISYSVPVDAVNDDGLNFPLSKWDVVLLESWGPVAESKQALDAIAGEFKGGTPELDQAVENSIQQALGEASTAQYALLLKPVAGVSFASQYAITVGKLSIPKMIDLEAPSGGSPSP